MIKFLEEYNQSPHDYAYWLALTESQPVFAAYSPHVARNEHKRILYVLNSYVEISINDISTTLSLKTICCHF